MAIPRRELKESFGMRISDEFRRQLEEAALKARLPTTSAFVRAAIVEKAAKNGIEIDPRG